MYIDPTLLKIFFVAFISAVTFFVGYALWKIRSDD